MLLILHLLKQWSLSSLMEAAKQRWRQCYNVTMEFAKQRRLFWVYQIFSDETIGIGYI